MGDVGEIQGTMGRLWDNREYNGITARCSCRSKVSLDIVGVVRED